MITKFSGCAPGSVHNWHVSCIIICSSSDSCIHVISITLFVTGFAFGHYHGKRSTKGTHHCKTDRSHKVSIYDDVLPSDDTHQEQAFKLRGNVAYLTSKSVWLSKINELDSIMKMNACKEYMLL